MEQRVWKGRGDQGRVRGGPATGSCSIIRSSEGARRKQHDVSRFPETGIDSGFIRSVPYRTAVVTHLLRARLPRRACNTWREELRDMSSLL